MRNWFVFFITFTFLLKVAFAAPTTMPKKWHYLNKLVEKEIKTIRTRGKKVGPRLRYRLVELHSEKIKLLREKENIDFLNAKSTFREEVGKTYFYKGSMKHFRMSRKEGLSLVKKFPDFISNGDVYYTLALNERDYNKEKDHKRFLKLSLKYAEAGSPTIHKAKVALAEYYYNRKEYKRAIRYYTDVLKYKGDGWYSKHLYNAAWCHIKVNKNKKAIKLLKQAFEYSKRAKYINIDNQIYKSIGLFYVTTGKPQKAVAFYLKKSKDPHPHLLKLAKMTTNQGNIKQSEMILNTALKVAIKKKNYHQQAEVLHNRLGLFYEFKRSKKIFSNARELLRLKNKHGLDVEIHEDSVQKVTLHVGFLQVELASHINRYDNEQKTNKSKRIIKFFNLLISFNKKDSDQYRFYQGETLYAIDKYEPAAKLYIKALEFSKKHKKTKKDKEFKRKILNSLFSALGMAEMTSNKIDKYNKYAYTNFLQLWPIDEKSPQIYKKLFNIHLKEKNATAATKVFTTYNKNYPKQLEIQRGMVSLIVDFHIKKKDFRKLSVWMIKLQNGYLGFKKKYIDDGLKVLAKMLFEKYERLAQKGKYKSAMKGYIGLYENKKYPRIIHAQSAYNTSLIYLDQGNVSKSLKWLKKSFKKFNKKQKIELKSKIYAISESYYLMQDFKNASRLSSIMVKTLCKNNHTILNDFYKNSVTFQLLEKNPSKALSNYNIYKQCTINNKVRQETANQMISFYSNNRNYKELLALNKVFTGEPTLKSFAIKSIAEAFWDLKLNQSDRSIAQIKALLYKNEFNLDIKKEIRTEIKNIRSFESYEALYAKTNLKLARSKGKFSEKSFNNNLQLNFTSLEEFTKSGEMIIKVKHPIITLAVYKMLQDKYLEMTKSLKGYTPSQMPKQFVNGFRKQMNTVAMQLQTKGNNYKSIAVTTMKRNKIYNKFGKEISGAEVLDDYRYPASKLTLPLDFTK